MVREAITTARERGAVRIGDIVVVLAGIDSHSRTTDVLRVVQVDLSRSVGVTRRRRVPQPYRHLDHAR